MLMIKKKQSGSFAAYQPTRTMHEGSSETPASKPQRIVKSRS
jgi:hypothetical protein